MFTKEHRHSLITKDHKNMVIAALVMAPLMILCMDLRTAYDLYELKGTLEGQVDAGLCTTRQPCVHKLTNGCNLIKDKNTWLTPVSSLVESSFPAVAINADKIYCAKHRVSVVHFVALPTR